MRKLFSRKKRHPVVDVPQRSTDSGSVNLPPQAESDPGSSEVLPVSSFPEGVKLLHNCPDAVVDICFVHGLTGNRDNTWTADGQTAPWPKTLLPSKLGNARILTFGYNAYLINNAAQDRLINHASNLLKDLADDRTECDASSRPIIFVAHSLGGIVCKKALLLSRTSRQNHLRSIFENTKGIVFMGTPHRGAWIANWAQIPISALGFMKATNPALLNILKPDDDLLRDIRDQFAEMILEGTHSMRVACFCEGLPLYKRLMVVPRDSAALDGHERYTISANHRDMVRFASAEEAGFKRLVGELSRWISELGEEDQINFLSRFN
ncbi:hypothetical protein GQ53DRAFT_636354 [Thozetella sp. PMI_491]|nr:hypothetical protein GQ53DRAFT_636354 [Thozetella sp. PMI_491]